MKKLRSSDDLNSFGEKGAFKDLGRKDEESSLSRSSSHRNFYYKSENGRKGLSSSSSRYDRLDDDRESSRLIRKRSDYDSESYDRRMSYDRYRDGSDRGILSPSPRGGYGGDRIHRSDSFSGSRRDFPKGFRSERDRSRRTDSVSSWRRFGIGKDVDEGTRPGGDSKQSHRLGPGILEVKQSKSVEVKKGEDIPVESDSSSEMEEGELEPEPEPEPAHENEPVAEDKAPVQLNTCQKELESGHQADNKTVEDGAKSWSEVEVNKDSVCEKKLQVRLQETAKDLVKEVEESSNSRSNSVQGRHCNEDVTETVADNADSKKEERARENNSCDVEGSKDTYVEKSMPKKEGKEDKGIDLEAKVGDIVLPESIEEASEGSGIPKSALSVPGVGITQNFMDKGKSVAVSPSSVGDSAEEAKVERELDFLLTCRDVDVEGPSIRGLELFSRDPVKQQEKPDLRALHKSKDEKLVLEPLDLSLSLPNVLLPINSHNMVQAPGSPVHARNTSTFQTHSDGFTASMSFSGSQQFTHNPSCSLTHNSFDNYEQSVGSRPLFQGVDQVSPATWHGQPSNEQKHKEGRIHQRVLPNGNGLYHQSQASQSLSNGHGVQGQQLRVAEGSSTMPIGLDRQLSLHRQLSELQSRHQNDVRTPSHSDGSHENKSEYSKEKKRVMRERDNDSLYKISNQTEKDQILKGVVDFVEPIIAMIVSEPVHVVAKKFNEITEQSMAYLKDSVRDIISNAVKQWQLSAFQKALQNRLDVTLEMLLKSHRAQLEILVALRTGLPEFLQRNYDISTSDLAEIFLNLRCRNLTCRNLLTVDECDCKVRVQKNGFCSTCMCIVCSKFDMASNTCTWVGCDVCLHWCHADCALRESYIRNGRSASAPHGATEIQFHCVACDHPSEMFGFVKEVFQNFAREWTAETLSKELEYVRRFFSASEDIRGKRLHDIAVLMLSRLANMSDLREVQNQIMGFLTGSDSFRSSTTPDLLRKELSNRNQEGTSAIAGSSQEPRWFKALYSEKTPQLDRASSLLPSFNPDENNKLTFDSYLQRSAEKEPAFDELDSIVRIKQEEAKMFQSRADEARRDAESLKRIAVAKNEKIEEEYTSRIAKLRLPEAEDIRKRKVEELLSLERSYADFLNTKVRMDADIKDLMLKMEATRQNFLTDSQLSG
ncbi:fibronectin type III domain protein [Actinidia rufa]|uniref:Fibronectin type III domain protein n=1 Tax=Actinidia rufa TaxID=165716 RepID=A0A7J0F0N0_9ERIC|nr:fibronectin type III domain protein [Actinidia rufa]